MSIGVLQEKFLKGKLPLSNKLPEWLPGWKKRVRLRIDHTKIDSDLTHFPVLIYLDAESGIGNADLLKVFDEVGSNRKRIAVTRSDGKTQLYVEIEKWDFEEIVIEDDVASFWSPNTLGVGSLGIISITNDESTKQSGDYSTKFEIGTGSAYAAGGIHSWADGEEDWSIYERLGMFIYGFGDGQNITIMIWDGTTVKTKIISDNFYSWQYFSWPLSDWADIDWTNVRYLRVLFYSIGDHRIDKVSVFRKRAWLWVSRDGWVIASSEETNLFLYYDNGHADNDTYVGDPNSTPAEAVWDSNFKLVCHMRDDPDTSHVRDSTSNNNDGTKKGANEPQMVTTGKIDDAQDFERSTSDFITVTDSLSLDGMSELTIECWVRFESVGALASVLFENWFHSDNNRAYLLQVETTKKIALFVSADGITYDNHTSTDLLETGIWYYLVGKWNGSSITVYIDTNYWSKGTSVSSLHDNTHDKSIGYLSSLVNRYLDGIVDELRISAFARTNSWLKASYETQRDNLLTFGLEELMILQEAICKLKEKDQCVGKLKEKEYKGALEVII